MAERPLHVPVLLGTVRRGRMSLPVARLLVAEAGRRPGVDTEPIELATVALRPDDAGGAIEDPEFAHRMRPGCDAVARRPRRSPPA
jgi:hypothetical protein